MLDDWSRSDDLGLPPAGQRNSGNGTESEDDSSDQADDDQPSEDAEDVAESDGTPLSFVVHSRVLS